MAYSRLGKSLTVATIAVSLVILGVLYLLSTSSDVPRSQRSTAVRFRPASLSTTDDDAQLAVAPTLGSTLQPRMSDEAYVALQYNGFFVALRVLGQSLRDSGTTRDMVALCMSDVPDHHKKILKKDGWIVRSLDPLPWACVGDHVYSRHFAKVQAWLLTEYRRVVLIDSDAIVLSNVDALFRCGRFCAAYRHSDLFNTGVVVLKPSAETFRNICSKIQSFGSFTNGDQGFLNHFYNDLKGASMFTHTSDSIASEKLQRLPAEYNGDVSVFYLTNQWMYLDNDEPYILHYTLGPVKPWKWWTYPLFPLNWKWKNLRDRLPPTDLWEPSLWDWDSWFPLALLLIYTLTAKLWVGPCTEHISKSSAVRYASTIFNPVGHYTMKIVPNFLLLTALYCGFYQVPETMYPIEGWTRCGLWTLMFFFLPLSVYCHLSYVVGLQSNGVKGTVSAVRPWNIVMEALLWTMTSVTIFYLQFFVPITMDTTMRRILSFFGLGLLNLVVCYWWGRRLVRLCYRLGLSHFLL